MQDLQLVPNKVGFPQRSMRAPLLLQRVAEHTTLHGVGRVSLCPANEGVLLLHVYTTSKAKRGGERAIRDLRGVWVMPQLSLAGQVTA